MSENKTVFKKQKGGLKQKTDEKVLKEHKYWFKNRK